MSNNTLFEEEPRKVHLYLAIRRKKENEGITCKQELCFRQIIYSQDGEEEELRVIKSRIQDKPGVWRIYKTVNARDTDKAQKIMLKWFIDGQYKGKRFDSVYSKALLQKECRAEKYALVDIDTKDIPKINAVRDKVRNQLQVQYGCEYNVMSIETPNGYHLVCKPFDKRILDEFDYADVDYDRFYFVDRITIGEQ